MAATGTEDVMDGLIPLVDEARQMGAAARRLPGGDRVHRLVADRRRRRPGQDPDEILWSALAIGYRR